MHGVGIGRAVRRCRRGAVLIVPGHGHVVHVMAHGGVVHARHCSVVHRRRLQRAADQRRKHHQQRRQDGELEQKTLRAGQAGHPASVEAGPGLPVRRTVAGGGLSAGLRPAPAASWSNSNSNSRSKSRLPVGRRGGSGCGRRRKPILGGLAAASMPRTLPQPDPPRLRQISAICSRSTPCVDESPSESNISNWNRKASTHGVDLSCRPRSTPTNSHRDLSEVGRCRSAGCQPHGCGCQAYRDVLAASPHSDTAPPTHGMPLLLLLLPLSAAGAGLQALLAPPPHTVMVWVSDSHVGGTGHAAAWLPSNTLRRSRGSICGASTCTSSSA